MGRLLALLIVAFALGASAPQPNPKNETEQATGAAQQHRGIAPITAANPKPVEVIQAKAKEPPCGPDQYETKDDLCAQWKSADAASQAATWAMVGTIVAFIGTCGLFWQINLTREAVQDTGDATKAMREANEIASRMGTAQVRAYLSLTIASIVYEGERRFTLHLLVTNSGQTPASNPHIRFWPQIIPADRTRVSVSILDGGSEHYPLGDISAQGAKEQAITFEIPEPIVLHAPPGNVLHFLIEAVYQDVFRARQSDTASFEVRDPQFRNPMVIRPAPGFTGYTAC